MIQIDIDMPACCFSCPLLQTYIGFSLKKYNYCGVNKKDVYNLAERAKLCPLIEVRESDGK